MCEASQRLGGGGAVGRAVGTDSRRAAEKVELPHRAIRKDGSGASARVRGLPAQLPLGVRRVSVQLRDGEGVPECRNLTAWQVVRWQEGPL